VASWIEGIAQLYASKRKSLEKLPDEARLKALCELNVGMQLASLASSPSVQQVWSQGRALDLHGLIYDLETGLLTDLGMSLRGPQDLTADLAADLL
jgi:carbonic anhydrase